MLAQEFARSLGGRLPARTLLHDAIEKARGYRQSKSEARYKHREQQALYAAPGFAPTFFVDGKVPAAAESRRNAKLGDTLAHLTDAGFPLLGDDKYGDFALNKQLEREGLKRMFLHAWRLDFRHPLSDAPISVSAPLPEELARYLAAVEQQEERDYG